MSRSHAPPEILWEGKLDEGKTVNTPYRIVIEKAEASYAVSNIFIEKATSKDALGQYVWHPTEYVPPSFYDYVLALKKGASRV